jgi:hypothetical protein
MKTAQEIEKEFLANMVQKTGKTLEGWMKAIGSSGKTGTREMVNWLKEAHHLGHDQAFLLATIHGNGGKPKYADAEGLLAALFAKDAGLRAVFEMLEQQVSAVVPDTRRVVMKSYVALNVERDYLVATPKAGALRVGLDLGDRAFDGPLVKAKIPGAMPRFSHMVELRSRADVTTGVVDLARASAARSAKKK